MTKEKRRKWECEGKSVLQWLEQNYQTGFDYGPGLQHSGPLSA